MNLESNTHFALELKEALNETLNLTINLEELQNKAFKTKITGESRRNINKIYREVEQFREMLEKQKIIKTQDLNKRPPKILQMPNEDSDEIKYPSLPKLNGKTVLRDTLKDSTHRLNSWKIGKGSNTDRNLKRSITPIERRQNSQDSTPERRFGRTMTSWAEKQKKTLDQMDNIEGRLKDFRKEMHGLSIFCEANPGVPWNNDKVFLRKLYESPEERKEMLKKYNEKYGARRISSLVNPGTLKQKLTEINPKVKDEKNDKNAITKNILAFFTELEKPPNYNMAQDPKKLLNRCVFGFKQTQTEQDKKLIDTLSTKSKSIHKSELRA
ncbi:unnamed protein product [Blepharisma stoltei]|uniref:Uncharacterized protein n=1 Tax=Blepharisma stoltei TaxID=1481888 RepID=A0AAU9J5I9_9CILI|nr:unnamed protein product [Blepharisma stoltei]